MSDLTRTSAAVKGLAEVYSNYISNVLSRTMIKPVISYDWMILQSDVKKIFDEPNNSGLIDAILIYLVKSIHISEQPEDIAEWTNQLINIALVKGLLSFKPSSSSNDVVTSTPYNQIYQHTVNSTLPYILVLAFFLHHSSPGESATTNFQITSLEQQIDQCFDVLSGKSQQWLALKIYNSITDFMLKITPHLPEFLSSRSDQLRANLFRVLDGFMHDSEQ